MRENVQTFFWYRHFLVYSEPLRRYNVFHVERCGASKMARFIAVANQKGGVGKTTTAVNLCAAAALTGHNCLIIDLDPQGNATTGLGVDKKPRDGAYLLVTSPQRAIETTVRTRIKRISAVPSSPTLPDAENSPLPDRALRLRASKQLLAPFYDYVFVDCPPSLGFFPTNALNCCDSVLVPIQCEYYAMEGLTQILSQVAAIKRTSNPDLEIEGILLTMYEPSAFSEEVIDEVQSHFPDLVCETKIPRDIALAEAPSHGLTILDYDHRSRGARAYLELAKEVMDNGEK